jgi:hypothetical protein
MHHEFNCILNIRVGGCHLTIMCEVFPCKLLSNSVYINQGYSYQIIPELSHKLVENGIYKATDFSMN